jgi:two-component system, cell cycle sensor histidine kinase and response regulator CckA
MSAASPSLPDIGSHSSSVRRPRRRRVSVERRRLQAQRLDSIAALASGVAHDLNNVFAPIIISAELLRKKLPGEEAQQCLNILLQSALQGSETLRQVLIIAGGFEGELVKLQPSSVIEELGNSLRKTLASGITMEMDICPDLWSVSGDSLQLRRMMLNLALNAAAAMANGGRLLIRAENSTVTSGMAKGHPGAGPGPHVLITVADTGRGIPPDQVDRIFDPFFPADGSEPGPGLGLSIVYGIARSHGGFIQVHSETDCGTEFEIFLPALTR